jgi:hypothetical protein
MPERSVGVSERWKKSTFSTQGECVEVRCWGGQIQVRDSKNPTGLVLEFTEGEWAAFLAGAAAGEFALPR